MLYVEWLRVRAAIKWTAIALGILFAIAAIVRIAIIGKQDYLAWGLGLKADPGAKVSDTVLPDGTHHISIDDPAKQVRVVIDDRGYRGKHMEIYDYSAQAKAHSEEDRVSMGSVNVTDLPHGRGTLTVVDTNGETSFRTYLIVALCLALIVATVLGAPFARENDGHLEVTLTKPIDRVRLAAGTIAVDVAALLAVLAIGVVFGIAIQSMFELPHITFDASTGPEFLACLLAPIAWYAMLTAATASFKRGWGAVLGFAWPVAILVVGLAAIQPNGSIVLTVVHGIGWVLSLVDPLTYMHFGSDTVVVGAGEASASGASLPPTPLSQAFAQAGMLGVLSALYSVLAIIQWRRIEA